MTTLFLKYRPQNFNDLVGQTAVVKTLKNAIKNGRAAHAYLFVGSRGTGKTSSARIFAKAINSHDPATGDVIETDLTQQIAAGGCVDIIEIDAASHTGVDNIRDLIDKVQFLPTYANKKVYIIDEVHMLSKGAFNALLKTLEEPPEHAYFVLATTELHKVPDTIVSRCQTFTFSRFTIEQIVNRLQKVCEAEKIKAEVSALEIVAKKAEGGLRDAISLLEQIAAEADNNVTEAITRQTLGISAKETLELFWQAISAGKTQSGLDIIAQLRNDGSDLRMFGHDFLRFLQTQMKASLNAPTLPRILKTIEVIEQALQRLKTSPIVELPLEIAVVKMGQSEQLAMSQQLPPQQNKTSQSQINSSVPVATAKTTAKKTVQAKPTVIENKKDVINHITPAAEPVPEKKFAPATVDSMLSNQDLPTGTDLKNSLEKIAQAAGFPIFVKKSFLQSIPKVVNGRVQFEFVSTFHFEQVDKSVHRKSIMDAITKIFGIKPVVEFTQIAKETVSSEQATQKATFDDLDF